MPQRRRRERPIVKKGKRRRANYVGRLNALAQAYRAAEEQIVSTYYTKPRSKRDHMRWLRAQAFKEYAAIRPTFTALARLYPEVDRGVDRHDFEGLTEKLFDETKHARLVMDLLEDISGKRVTFADLLWLPQDRKLARIRAKYSKSHAGRLHEAKKRTAQRTKTGRDEIERAAVTLTEGGGRALYEVCSRLKKQGIQGKIARVFREIFLDEVEHKRPESRALESLIKNETSFRRAAKIICEVSGQRLRMRNEQFGFPVNRNDLLELEKHARKSLTNA